MEQLRGLAPGTAWRAAAFGLVAAAVIGIPADLIDTPLFARPIDPRGIDYVIWAVTAVLIGLIFAIRVPTSPDSDPGETRAVWGGLVSFLAIGCPVCNQVVVALVGTSGALSWWAPAQPLVGAAAIALLVLALRRRLASYQLAACPIPVP